MNISVTCIIAVCSTLSTSCLAIGDPPPIAEAQNAKSSISYPWSESASHARISKAFLSHFDIIAAVQSYEDPRNPQWEITDDFIKLYGLTHKQATSAGNIISNAGFRIRRAEGDHMVAMTNSVDLGPYRAPAGLKVLEQASFELVPYPKVLKAIENETHQELVGCIGKTRTAEFWRQSPQLLSAFDKFGQNDPIRLARVEQTTSTIRLIEFRGRLSVYRVLNLRSWDPDGIGRGEGVSGCEWFTSDDPFCPTNLTTALKRWRQSIQDYSKTNNVAAERPIEPPPKAGMKMNELGQKKAAESLPAKPSYWDENSEFVDFPKEALPLISIPVITRHKLTLEAIALFGLSKHEAQAVDDLYTKLRLRFETAEKASLERLDPKQRRFILRAFPAVANNLRVEWETKLKPLVGETRAKWFNTSLVNQAYDPAITFPVRHPRGDPNQVRMWSTWLLRGSEEVEFEIKSRPDNPSEPRVLFKLLKVNRENDFRGGMPQSLEPFYRAHLFGPEILDFPKEL